MMTGIVPPDSVCTAESAAAACEAVAAATAGARNESQRCCSIGRQMSATPGDPWHDVSNER
jgi:hypothetical protein